MVRIDLKDCTTVKGLIEELEHYDDNMPVVTMDYCGDYEEAVTTPRTITIRNEKIEVIVIC